MGRFNKKMSQQELSKNAQSGHTDRRVKAKPGCVQYSSTTI